MLPMGSISGSGNVISADSMCTETKPTDKDNPQCLCTYQSNPALNCSWSKETTCSAGNIGIPVTHEDSYGTSQAGNLPAIKECGSSGFENSKICCCPPANKSCVNCSAIGAAGIPISPNACCTNCAVTIPCQASSDLIAELLKFKDIYNNWQVTGAAPPTPGIHKSSCHTAGTCVDLNSSNPKALFDALKKQDTPMKSFQYECTDSNSCCSELYSYMGSYCKDKSNDMGFDATANHFHVNQ
jgi:hypothetical protein